MKENQKPILLQDLGMQYPKETSKHKTRYGLYLCFCGKEFISQAGNINNEHTKSCGCYQKQNRVESNTTHGLRYHDIYDTWKNIIQRCTKPNNKGFKNYGGRGITVCDRWLDVVNFIEDMYPTYQKGLSIDRINNDGNYEPSNCRWTTRIIQNRNTRKLRKTNTSGYRGVCWSAPRSKWKSYIGVNGKQKSIGYFNTSLEASMAYDQYIIENNLEHTINGVCHENI